MKGMKKRRPFDEQVDLVARSVILHIPKTGGMGLRAMSNQLEALGHGAPRVLKHDFTFALAASQFPNAKISFMIRDPIERAASAFLSRMRMGRPVKNVAWTAAEAAAFSFFKEPYDWFQAIVSDDDRLLSAANFAYQNIGAVARNYIYYFGTEPISESCLRRVGFVGEVHRTNDFLKAVLSDEQHAEALIARAYSPIHISPVSAREQVARLSKSQLEKVQRFFAQEYAVYQKLHRLVNC